MAKIREIIKCLKMRGDIFYPIFIYLISVSSIRVRRFLGNYCTHNQLRPQMVIDIPDVVSLLKQRILFSGTWNATIDLESGLFPIPISKNEP